VPDLVIKAGESVNDSEKIKKIKENERGLTVKFNKNNNLNNNMISNDNHNSQILTQNKQDKKLTTIKKMSSESEKSSVSNRFKGGSVKIVPK
jgi:transcription-repair coupling factor (superfamily II helicase)